MGRSVRLQRGGGRPFVHAAAHAFDRVGERAWTLAHWVTCDENSATQAVVAVFGERASDRMIDWDDDATLLREVRSRALAWAPDQLPHGASVVAARIAAMPAAQREVVELAVVGRLAPTTIARSTGASAREVSILLNAGVRELEASAGRRGERLEV